MGWVEDAAEIHAAIKQLLQHWEGLYMYINIFIYFLKNVYYI